MTDNLNLTPKQNAEINQKLTLLRLNSIGIADIRIWLRENTVEEECEHKFWRWATDELNNKIAMCEICGCKHVSWEEQ